MAVHPFSRFLTTALLSVSFVASANPAGAAALPGPLETLQSSLLALSSHAPGHIGIAVEELSTGLSNNVNAAANMPAASTIKIPVMVEVFRRMELGDLTFNTMLTLQKSDRDWGWGDLADAPSGSRYSVNKLLRLMITESDNTATNMLIRLVGRQHVNETMHRLGLHNTELADYIRSDGDIRSLRTSAADMAQLLTIMAHEKLVDAWSSREMLAILAGQQHNGLIPAPLPQGIAIAHKTGTLHDTLNDVGIVFLNNDPYVIAVMTTSLPNLDDGRAFIHSVSHDAYLAFSQRVAEGMNGVPQLPQTEPDHTTIPDTKAPVSVDMTAADQPDMKMWSPALPGKDDLYESTEMAGGAD